MNQKRREDKKKRRLKRKGKTISIDERKRRDEQAKDTEEVVSLKESMKVMALRMKKMAKNLSDVFAKATEKED